ncbi:MAG: hypothetical protein IMW89_14175 [Ktedonobacteraceae bacterium]|nr:hypothetical protein [Ktedonobacteraceae bacterium]
MNSLNNVIVFDLDGVITSERAYWMTAGLVLHELLYSPRYWNVHGATSYTPAATEKESWHAANEALPEAVIIKLKARSVNSNWDTCYVGVCIRLIDLLASLPDISPLLPLQPWNTAWIARLRSQCTAEREKRSALISAGAFRRLDEPALHGYSGLGLIDHLDAYASGVLGHPIEHVFRRSSPFWQFCANLFRNGTWVTNSIHASTLMLQHRRASRAASTLSSRYCQLSRCARHLPCCVSRDTCSALRPDGPVRKRFSR